ncbi:MAG: hypothetical protein WBD53_08075 [Xanthobacteraceae bacterium]
MPDSTPASMADSVMVPTKSAWLSKINWTQGVSSVAMVLTLVSGGKLNLTADQQVAIVVTIGIVGDVATWVIKTWFTPTVTPASVRE